MPEYYYPPSPFPRCSAFTLVMLFCTPVHLSHHLCDICCRYRVETSPNHKIPSPWNWVNLRITPVMVYILDDIKNDPLACLPTLSFMDVQFRGRDRHIHRSWRRLVALRNAFATRSKCFGGPDQDDQGVQVLLTSWSSWLRWKYSEKKVAPCSLNSQQSLVVF